MMPASREARQVQRLSISTGPLMTRPARYDDVPSCTTPLSRGGVQFEEITLAPASKERAFLTASQPADFMKKASDNSVKLIRVIVSDTARAWQLRSPASTRDSPEATPHALFATDDKPHITVCWSKFSRKRLRRANSAESQAADDSKSGVQVLRRRCLLAS